MAEASHWFERYRGLAVTIVASGNYIAGTIWPPLVQQGHANYGWRATHFGIALVCVVLMTILLLVLRQHHGRQRGRAIMPMRRRRRSISIFRPTR